MRLMRAFISSAIFGFVFGFFIGISFDILSLTKLHFFSGFVSLLRYRNLELAKLDLIDQPCAVESYSVVYELPWKTNEAPAIPRGAERLPPGIISAESDLYLRRLWGNPDEDLTIKQKYLVAFTVGYEQRFNIDAAIKKFSENFTIVLFHYDGRASEWDEFEWSKRAIHVSVRKQTKWWYAKRFLHPDIVAEYEYVFIWDEDLGVQHFNAEEYISLVKKYGLEISQPGAAPDKSLTWQMTKRRSYCEVHKETKEREGRCTHPHLPPCAAFIEIMAPVFSRSAWRCVWHMIQNDLVHGWGIDFDLQRCVESAHEQIGVVDSQWIVHRSVPSLDNQGPTRNGEKPSQEVRKRCRTEWQMFKDRMKAAEADYFNKMGIISPNLTYN